MINHDKSLDFEGYINQVYCETKPTSSPISRGAPLCAPFCGRMKRWTGRGLAAPGSKNDPEKQLKSIGKPLFEASI